MNWKIVRFAVGIPLFAAVCLVVAVFGWLTVESDGIGRRLIGFACCAFTVLQAIAVWRILIVRRKPKPMPAGLPPSGPARRPPPEDAPVPVPVTGPTPALVDHAEKEMDGSQQEDRCAAVADPHRQSAKR